MTPNEHDRIYRLVDPRTKRPFYVGRTNNRKRRLDEHLREAARHPETAKAHLISHLAQSGFTPDMEIIDDVPHSQSSSAEHEHIARHGTAGWLLTNILMNKGSRSDLDLGRLVPDLSLDPLQMALHDVTDRVREAAAETGALMPLMPPSALPAWSRRQARTSWTQPGAAAGQQVRRCGLRGSSASACGLSLRSKRGFAQAQRS